MTDRIRRIMRDAPRRRKLRDWRRNRRPGRRWAAMPREREQVPA